MRCLGKKSIYFNIEDQKFLFETLKKRFFIQFVVDLDKERYRMLSIDNRLTTILKRTSRVYTYQKVEIRRKFIINRMRKQLIG